MVVRVNVWVLVVGLHLALSLSINSLPHTLPNIVVSHNCTKVVLLVAAIGFPLLILLIGEISMVILKFIPSLMSLLNLDEQLFPVHFRLLLPFV